MATTTMVTCDYHADHSTPASAISFSLDGKSYSLDLCDSHADKLRSALQPFVSIARGSSRTTRRGEGLTGRTSARAATGRRADLGEIRVWARKQGWDVSDRGRVAGEIIESYDKMRNRRKKS